MRFSVKKKKKMTHKGLDNKPCVISLFWQSNMALIYPPVGDWILTNLHIYC